MNVALPLPVDVDDQFGDAGLELEHTQVDFPGQLLAACVAEEQVANLLCAVEGIETRTTLGQKLEQFTEQGRAGSGRLQPGAVACRRVDADHGIGHIRILVAPRPHAHVDIRGEVLVEELVRSPPAANTSEKSSMDASCVTAASGYRPSTPRLQGSLTCIAINPMMRSSCS